MDRAGIYAAVDRERDYQDAKWASNPHSVGEWLLILEREVQEAKEAWCKGRGDTGALEEVLQVVAVGVAALEAHGVVERPSVTLLTKMWQAQQEDQHA